MTSIDGPNPEVTTGEAVVTVTVTVTESASTGATTRQENITITGTAEQVRTAQQVMNASDSEVAQWSISCAAEAARSTEVLVQIRDYLTGRDGLMFTPAGDLVRGSLPVRAATKPEGAEMTQSPIKYAMDWPHEGHAHRITVSCEADPLAARQPLLVLETLNAYGITTQGQLLVSLEARTRNHPQTDDASVRPQIEGRSAHAE